MDTSWCTGGNRDRRAHVDREREIQGRTNTERATGEFRSRDTDMWTGGGGAYMQKERERCKMCYENINV